MAILGQYRLRKMPLKSIFSMINKHVTFCCLFSKIMDAQVSWKLPTQSFICKSKMFTKGQWHQMRDCCPNPMTYQVGKQITVQLPSADQRNFMVENSENSCDSKIMDKRNCQTNSLFSSFTDNDQRSVFVYAPRNLVRLDDKGGLLN